MTEEEFEAAFDAAYTDFLDLSEGGDLAVKVGARMKERIFELSTRLSAAEKERDEAIAGGILYRTVLEPFAKAYEPAAEQARKYNVDEGMQAFLDRNTVTPTLTMGDFRRAFEALSTPAPAALSHLRQEIEQRAKVLSLEYAAMVCDGIHNGQECAAAIRRLAEEQEGKG